MQQSVQAEQSKGKIHYAWFILVGLCVIVGLGRGGLNNSASLFLTPVTEDLGIGMGALTLYFSVASTVTMLGLPIAGKIIAKYDIRLVLIVATISQAGAFAMFGFMNSVWGWYIFAMPLSFGALFITQMSGPVLINQWFKKGSGLAIGVMMASSGALGALIQPVVGKLIVNQGWRSAYTIVGLVVMAVTIILTLLIIRKPEDKNMLPYGDDSKINMTGGKAVGEMPGVTLADAKKSSGLYALIMFFFLITSFSSFALHIPSYAISLGYDIAFSSGLMSTYLGGSVIGSLFFGFLSDKFGAKNTALFAMITGIVALVTLIFLASSTPILIVGVGLFGISAASTGTLGPVLTSSLFGAKEYGQIFSNVSLGLAVAGIVALPMYGYILEFTGSYTIALYAMLLMLAVAIVSIIVAFKSKEKMEKDGLWN